MTMPFPALTIDGSHGEGGGQTLRTALALSAITRRPLELTNIRKGRPSPGLANQHLTCVRAVAAISQAEVDGAGLGSTRLRFSPSTLQGGRWEFDVAQERGSAGSVALVWQALLPALSLAPVASRVSIRGGTHVPWSPPVHYVQAVLLPMLGQLGIRATVELIRAGWYPNGGGEIRAAVEPVAGVRPAMWNSRGSLRRIHGWSLVSNLPRSIAERQQRAATERLTAEGLNPHIDCVELPASSPGTCVVLIAECERSCAGFTALGQRGTPSERVGREAADQLLAFLQTTAAIDEHLADQVSVFLALASQASSLRGGRPEPARAGGFTTSRITRHLLTTLWLVEQWLPVHVRLTGREGEPGAVVFEPAGHEVS